MGTLTNIIITFALGFSICLNIMLLRRRSETARELAALRIATMRDKAHRESLTPNYQISECYSGNVFLYRVTGEMAGDSQRFTLIKVFDTKDADYNRREAEDLKECLERELCYD